MNWEALGAIGEIVGAIAVVVTLGYLAVQIQQNTKTMRRSAHQSAIDSMSNSYSAFIENPEVAEMVVTGFQHPEKLVGKDIFRFDRFVGTYLMNMDNLFFQHRDGMIESERWESYEASLRTFCLTRGFEAYWEKQKYRFSRSFQAEIDRLRSS